MLTCCDVLITEECFHIYVEKMLFVEMHNVSQIENLKMEGELSALIYNSFEAFV